MTTAAPIPSDRDLVGRPLAARRDGSLAWAEPVRVAIRAGRIASVERLGGPVGDRPVEVPVQGDADAVLLPGLADSHLHLVATAAALAGRDLASDHPGSIEELLARLSVLAARTAPGAWLRVSGFEESRLREGRFPTSDELDRAVGDVPLRLRHATRHASLLGSTGRRRLGEVLGPQAGRRGDDSAVFGREVEITAALGPHDGSALREGLRSASALLASRGVTTLDEVTGSNDAARVELLADAVERGDVCQRVRVFVRDAELASSAVDAAAGRVEIAGVKLFAHDEDEAAAPRFAAAVARARWGGLPVAVHAVEPDVVARVLEVLRVAPPRDRAGGPGRGSAPDRIEHASLCPPELARAIAAAGVAVVTQPGFLRARGAKYLREVEEPLHAWLYPLRTLARAGVTVAGGSDSPIGPLDPAVALAAAVDRSSSAGAPIAVEEAISPAEALGLYASGARRVRGEAFGGVGWLGPGAIGDLAVLAGGAAWLPGLSGSGSGAPPPAGRARTPPGRANPD